jgi:hypothetical protein
VKDSLSKAQFINALSKLRKPSVSQLKFLGWHARAKGRAANMRRLAKIAGYASWRGMNLRYGILARDIGEAAGVPEPNISLLVEFIPPDPSRNISNSEWILVMREPFAEALESVNWI